MLDNGDDPAKVTDATWNARSSSGSQSAVDSGQIRRFTGNDYAQPLAKGDLAAAVAWSGDIFQLLSSNPKLKWAMPDEGRDDLDGQHDHPDRRQRRRRRRRT